MAHKKGHYVVIGLGTFGMSVARRLTDMGDNVLGIDIDMHLVQNMSDEIGSTIEADASDIKALRECNLKQYDTVLISIGENIQSSVLAAMNALDLGCKSVWVKAQNNTHQKILQAIGVHEVVLPEHSYGEVVAERLYNSRIVDFIPISDDSHISVIDVGKQYEGRAMSDLMSKEGDGIDCLGIIRDNVLLRDDILKAEIQIGDKLLLVAQRDVLRRFVD